MAIAGLSNSIVNTFNLTLTGRLNLNAKLSATGSAAPGTPLPNRADIFTDSFLFVDRGFPVIDDLRGPLSALRVAQGGRFLTETFQDSGLPALDEFNKKNRFVQLQSDALQDLRTRLQRLQSSVQTLRETGALNLLTGFSSNPEVVEVTVDNTASLSRFELKGIQQATRERLVSDAQSLGALGLSGSFSINGVEVTVTVGDTLLDIANKINRGEDTNGNGTLDGAEDFNGNGSIDIIEIEPTEFFEGLFVIEDRNNNGVLDPSEDANGNGRLDGGTAETGVTATLSADNRLELTAAEGERITLDDTDGLLLQLGFFTLNSQGVSVQKEKQLVTVNGQVQDLNQSARNAAIEIDGRTFQSDTNTFDNVLNGVTLTLTGTSNESVQVRVQVDARAAATQIRSLVDRFNDTITAFNKILGGDRLFARDLDIQTLRNDLIQNSQGVLRRVNQRDARTQSQAGSQQDNRSLGIDSVNVGKTSFQEVGLTNAVRSLQDSPSTLFKHVGSKLFRELSAIGIRSEFDDTLKINRPQLERALQQNPGKVFDILTREDGGILSSIEPVLEKALSGNLGVLDFKQEQIRELSQVPSKVAELFQQNSSNDLLRNLIAVV
ncbi:flagellar filament capping protein FliD [Nitrospina watsonii]|uniref:Flagellar hook-associated protein 2 n=1 Tax=Nitrospina watsonii TaxID=1323948 RepID=A0ABM9HB46_9BACT|nr:flagellar filament capping protein FliD [Nitrospina watsonii]CAI2717407.1 Flagellar hook-associated protein 2 [Nitrospina watsonii]